MVDCADFLEFYSDFRDGHLPAERKEGFEAHLRACDSCARYDRVVGGGVRVFRSLPEPTPSPDFQTRLLGQLYALESASGRHGSGASLAVTLMICAVIGLGAWVPALRPDGVEAVILPPIVAHAPYHDLAPVLMRAAATPAHAAVIMPERPPQQYHSRNLLLQEPLSLKMLAYRPVTYYGQR